LLAEDELLRGCCEVGKAGDGEILVVEIRVVANEFVGLGLLSAAAAESTYQTID
jgi:hypothetical protein